MVCRTFLCLLTNLFKELPIESFACTNHKYKMKFKSIVSKYLKSLFMIKAKQTRRAVAINIACKTQERDH